MKKRKEKRKKKKALARVTQINTHRETRKSSNIADVCVCVCKKCGHNAIFFKFRIYIHTHTNIHSCNTNLQC